MTDELTGICDYLEWAYTWHVGLDPETIDPDTIPTWSNTWLAGETNWLLVNHDPVCFVEVTGELFGDVLDGFAEVLGYNNAGGFGCLEWLSPGDIWGTGGVGGHYHYWLVVNIDPVTFVEVTEDITELEPGEPEPEPDPDAVNVCEDIREFWGLGLYDRPHPEPCEPLSWPEPFEDGPSNVAGKDQADLAAATDWAEALAEALAEELGYELGDEE